MTVDPDVWEPGSGSLGGPPVADDDLFRRFESDYGVRLPDLLQQMYRLQNGGTLRDVPSVDCLLPLTAGRSSCGYHICSLQLYAEAGGMVTADDLDWLEEEVGNPKRIFPLTCDGHRCYALDYNRRQPDGEPAVIHLDFECGDTEYVAPSFSAWIGQLTRDEPHCAVDSAAAPSKPPYGEVDRFVPEPAEDSLELDPKFLRDLDQLDQMVAEGLKQLLTPEAELKAALPTEPPAPGAAPDAMTEDELVEELTGLILYFVGQVPKVHTEDDAQRLIDGFATLRPRYIELYRALYAAGPTNLMRLLPAERVGQEAMNALLQRNSAAYLRLDEYGRETVSEALQPKQRDPRVQKLLARYLRATAQLADLLERVNRDNAIAPHQAALEAAIAEYADCDRRFCKLVRQLHTLEPAVAHRKRIQSEAFASLQRHWNELRTRHRDLYKAHRELFDPLPDYHV